jgi:murein DD-endopeptidase MepM/ murein hydrolase activator NlpD
MKIFLTFAGGVLTGAAITVALTSNVIHADRKLREPVKVSSAGPANLKADAPGPREALGVLEPTLSDEERLMRRRLAVPITGYRAEGLHDSFSETRGNHAHEAIDLMAPRGTPVVAVDDGKIGKLFRSVPGGLTIYQFDREQIYCYYYAHLDRYAEGIVEGNEVKRGDLLAYVGSSGNADPSAPHLHFAIFKLGPEKKWWDGTPINPFRILFDAASH